MSIFVSCGTKWWCGSNQKSFSIFSFSLIELKRMKRLFQRQVRKEYTLMLLNSDYNIKQKWKGKTLFLLLLFWPPSHFIFILLTAVKHFPPICYFLLNFLLDYSLLGTQVIFVSCTLQLCWICLLALVFFFVDSLGLSIYMQDHVICG